MRTSNNQNLDPPTDSIYLWIVVVWTDSGLKTGIANTFLDAQDIAFSLLDESRSSFLAWCNYHDRPSDKEAFFEFLEICKSEFEQVHIDLMEVPLPDILAGEVCATNVVDFASTARHDEYSWDGGLFEMDPPALPIDAGPNVIAFPPPRDPDEVRLDQAIEIMSTGQCGKAERDEAICTIFTFALRKSHRPVGRRAAEWACFWLYDDS